MLQRINLVPKEPFHVRLKRTSFLLSSFLIFVAIIFSFTNYILVKEKVDTLKKEVNELRKDASEVEALSIKANSLRQFIDQLRKKIANYEADIAMLNKKRRIVPDFKGALTELSYAVNSDVRLTHIYLNSQDGILQGEVKKVEAMPIFLETIKKYLGPIDEAELMELEKYEVSNKTIYKFKVHITMKHTGKS